MKLMVGWQDKIELLYIWDNLFFKKNELIPGFCLCAEEGE